MSRVPNSSCTYHHIHVQGTKQFPDLRVLPVQGLCHTDQASVLVYAEEAGVPGLEAVLDGVGGSQVPVLSHDLDDRVSLQEEMEQLMKGMIDFRIVSVHNSGPSSGKTKIATVPRWFLIIGYCGNSGSRILQGVRQSDRQHQLLTGHILKYLYVKIKESGFLEEGETPVVPLDPPLLGPLKKCLQLK